MQPFGNVRRHYVKLWTKFNMEDCVAVEKSPVRISENVSRLSQYLTGFLSLPLSQFVFFLAPFVSGYLSQPFRVRLPVNGTET